MGHIEANSRAEGQEDSRRRTISFSSEEPYRRWFGMEILDHAENALDLSRLNDVGVLLFNHDRTPPAASICGRFGRGL